MLSRVDHLLYFSPCLEQGCDEIENLFGIRPQVAGRHPGFGTCNALLSLGEGTYFEVIAPDPGLEPPQRGVLFALDRLEAGRLGTWVMCDEAIQQRHARASSIGLGALESGHRLNPDGSKVEWVASNPFAFPLDGLVPFLIAWGDTPHPSTQLPDAGRLVSLEFEHPDPAAVNAAFELLGLDFNVAQAQKPGMRAIIETVKGRINLA